jgi:SAM-dependent methyltransferase
MSFSEIFPYKNRIYRNKGNGDLLSMLQGDCKNILDIGCGDGSNARLIKQLYPNAMIDGVTLSSVEMEVAKKSFNKIWLLNIEDCARDSINFSSTKYDVLIFSHVLEYFRYPEQVLKFLLGLLIPGGQILIAVPNILNWRMRLKFLRGIFEYEDSGPLDNTHLRFFTYHTADTLLLASCTELVITDKSVSGDVPLWLLRRYLLPDGWVRKIDYLGCKYFPNLFGSQVLIRVVMPQYSLDFSKDLVSA